MSSLRSRRRGRTKPEKRRKNACTGLLGLCVLTSVIVLGGLTALILGLPALKFAAGANMTDYFEGSTVIGKFMLNCIWITFLMLGILFGTMHRWWKEEGILQGGLEEWREWRQR